ncbi:MAG: rhodanese-like domain-containing protein, partial [Alphaproteobacteria bacterium]
MATNSVRALVDAEWLAGNLNSPHVAVVDGSWHLPTINRDPLAEFETTHIPGAVFFDIDRIADDANPLPHMIPSDEKFAGQVSALGIGNDDHIIAYDTTGVGSAARVWWMFHLFGHDRVSVLDGGLPIWQKSGGPVEDQVPVPTTTNFTARLNRDLLRTTEDLLRNIETGAEQVLDARTQ